MTKKRSLQGHSSFPVAVYDRLMGMLSQLNIKNSGQKYYFLLLFGLFLGTCAIYLRTLGYQFFIFDDQNHYLFALKHLDTGLIKLITEEKTLMPVFYKAWSLLLGGNEQHHIIILRFVNILIHYLNAILVYLLVRHYAHSALLSFFTALIFFIHPAQVESIVWVSSMKGTLSSFFALSSWLLLVNSKRRWPYLISLFFFLMALLTKPTVAVMPLLILTVESIFSGKKKSHLFLYLLPFFIFSTAIGFYQIWTYTPGIEHHIWWYLSDTIKRSPYYFIIFILSLLTLFTVLKKTTRKKQLKVICSLSAFFFILPWLKYYDFLITKLKTIFVLIFYSFYKVVIPLIYSFDYGINNLFISKNIPTSFIAAALIFIIGITYVLRKEKKALLCLFLFILLTLPHSGLFYFSFAEISYFADRYIYLSIVPATLFFLFLIKSKKKVIIFGSIVCLVFTALSARNAYIWYSSDAILRHTLNINPLSLSSSLSLASFYEKEKKTELALTTLKKAAIAQPSAAQAYLKALSIMAKNERYNDMLSYGLNVIESNPRPDSKLFYYLGLGFLNKNQNEMAEAYFERYLMINGDDLQARQQVKMAKEAHSLKNPEKSN